MGFGDDQRMKLAVLVASLCIPGLFASHGAAPLPDVGAVCTSAEPTLACSDAGRACSVDRNCCSGTCSKGTCR